jgi:hypothetical protein
MPVDLKNYLESKHRCDAKCLPGNFLGHVPSGRKVDTWDDECGADKPSQHTMAPLPIENAFELIQRHMSIEPVIETI